MGTEDNAAELTRRKLIKGTLTGTALAMAAPLLRSLARTAADHPLRLGGPVYEETTSPEAWVNALKRRGYGAAYCPLKAEAADDEVQAYEKAAQEANIVVAEVGAWSNPLSDDASQRRAARAKCRQQLALAERIGARCCVNISGSRAPNGPAPTKRTSRQRPST